MAKYGNKYTGIFVPDQDLKDSTSLENPVPYNLDQPKQIDDFFRELMETKELMEKTKACTG